MLRPELLQQLQTTWSERSRMPQTSLVDCIEHVQALLSHALLFEGQAYAFIFNPGLAAYEWVSPQVTQVLGYAPQEISFPFTLSCIHPQDLPWLMDIEYTLVQTMGSLPLAARMAYKVRYDFRVRHANGRYVRLQHQMMTLEQDESGNLVRTLGIHSDISHLKQEGRPVLSLLSLCEGFPTYMDYPIQHQDNHGDDLRNQLDNRERQLLKLLIRGYSSSEIAKELSLTHVSIERQRRGLFHKMQVQTTDELCMVAMRHGWL